MIGLARQRKPFDVPVEAEQRAAGGEDRAISRQQCEAYEAAAAENLFGITIGGDPHDAAASRVGGGNVKISLAVECQSLRPAESSEKRADFAFLIDAKHAVETRGRGAGHKQFAGGAEREMVSCDGRLERRKHENFPRGADLENRAAAVAHK